MTTTPSSKLLELTLRKTTEHLAHELRAPAANAPDWTEMEWRVATVAAAVQGIAVLLASRLRWRGPTQWQQFLEEQSHHGVARQKKIEALLGSIDSGAKRSAIGVVGLKGSALLALNLYEMGERPMGDIDLLVCPETAPAAVQAVINCGYCGGTETWRHATFEPKGPSKLVGYGEHIDNPIKVELHTRIVERLPIHEVDITQSILAGEQQPGMRSYPSNAALMRHLLLHAAGGIRARALRFIQLHDIAILAPRIRDWNALFVGSDELWWAYPVLALIERYFGNIVPPEVAARMARHCPAWLRRRTRMHSLTDVSWSQLRIEAFPGIEWSHSPIEAMRFVRSRVFPSRRSIAALRHTAATLSWAQQIPWYGQFHLQRIARWLISQPRAQTMYSVRSALADHPRHNA